MHPVVARAEVLKALRKRAVMLAVSFGFDRDTRLDVAGMMLGRSVGSFGDLDERELRKVVFGFEAAAFVIEGVRQGTIAARRRAIAKSEKETGR